MKKLFLFASMFSVTAFYACDTGKREQTTEVQQITQPDRGQISLNPMEEAPDFPDAILEQHAPEEGANLPAGNVSFEYNVKNFQLTQQTEAEHANNLVNSHKGQHIHLILNNEPYDALYETSYTKELEEGHYVELSFLSRSFHMSLKHPDAYVLRQFTVGNGESANVDLNAPHLFYSRPKGTYTGSQQTDKVMLDFYLVNTELSEEGHKIRATINGEQFMIYEWRPYAIEGLPMGESLIRLELLDENNERVDSPLNPVSRKIIIQEEEQQEAPAS
jgi:hypothetical protein